MRKLGFVYFSNIFRCCSPLTFHLLVWIQFFRGLNLLLTHNTQFSLFLSLIKVRLILRCTYARNCLLYDWRILPFIHQRGVLRDQAVRRCCKKNSTFFWMSQSISFKKHNMKHLSLKKIYCFPINVVFMTEKNV